MTIFDIATIAATNNITADVLASALSAGGWDFSPLDQGNEAHVTFAVRVAQDYAQRISAAKAARLVREATKEARRIAAMTPAAKARPDRVCGKCDGKGVLRCFGHIANGACFQCKGAGIIRLRSDRF